MLSKKTRETAIEYRKNGMTFNEIADALGISQGSARNICIKAGISGLLWKEVRYQKMREYKAQGHSLSEVAKHFNVDRSTAQKICRGIAPQSMERTAEKTYGEREQNAIEMIKERAPMFEYAGGYIDMDSPCQIRCKTCGTVTTRSFVTIRHKKAQCAVCTKRERLELEEARNAELLRLRKLKEEQRKAREAEKEAEKARKEKERKSRTHPCIVCGKTTTNKYCCSNDCYKKYYNQQHEAKRRVKIQSAMVDKDITLQKLFMRDNGVCHLCGGLCDWNDKEERDGTIICGNEYPSIDHVIPLSKGGMHAWDNVKLAHRLCNTCKSDKIIPRTLFS